MPLRQKCSQQGTIMGWKTSRNRKHFQKYFRLVLVPQSNGSATQRYCHVIVNFDQLLQSISASQKERFPTDLLDFESLKRNSVPCLVKFHYLDYLPSIFKLSSYVHSFLSICFVDLKRYKQSECELLLAAEHIRSCATKLLREMCSQRVGDVHFRIYSKSAPYPPICF